MNQTHKLIFIKTGEILIDISFDYKAYLKNNPLLEELPKGQWIDLDKKDTIEKVMKGKAIDIQDDGSYTRYIGGKETKKILLGKPLT